MKKIFLLIMMLTTSLFAQCQVTKFLGIPVDGFKKDMIKKLEAKGYEYNPESDFLSGEFNGEDVLIFIQTHNNKVWRIAIAETAHRNESEIKTHFNNLCKQFENNERYKHNNARSQSIPEEENIRQEMSINNKEYLAMYFQTPSDPKEASLFEEYTRYITITLLKNKYHMTLDSLKNENPSKKEAIMKDIASDAATYLLDGLKDRTVWFKINKIDHMSYHLLIFYENDLNQTKGKDL